MNSPESLNTKSKNLFELITTNWESLDESQKSILTKIWKVLTYKWQLQILFNLPFLIWWLMDVSIIKAVSYTHLTLPTTPYV